MCGGADQLDLTVKSARLNHYVSFETRGMLGSVQVMPMMRWIDFGEAGLLKDVSNIVDLFDSGASKTSLPKCRNAQSQRPRVPISMSPIHSRCRRMLPMPSEAN